MEKDGLWKYSPAGGWEHLSANEAHVGVDVRCIGIKARPLTAKLVIGTHGQELYYKTITTPIQFQTVTQNPEKRPRLVLFSIRPEGRSGRMSISFSLEEASPLEMRVYDVRGRVVVSKDTPLHPPGKAQLVWDGHSNQGMRCAPGVYFLRLKAGPEVVGRKFVVLK
jgi:hypothetical protein